MKNNPSEVISLPDMQKSRDERGIEIDRVGVSNVRYPLNVHLRDGDTLNTVANLSLGVSLPHAEKGTHMSRFMTFLNEKSQLLRLDTVHMALGVCLLCRLELLPCQRYSRRVGFWW